MSPYLLAAPAARDVDEILDYIAPQSTKNALLVAKRFEKAFEMLAEFPLAGRLRQELDDPNARVWPVSGYLIIYDPVLEPVHILRVVRAARSLSRVRAR